MDEGNRDGGMQRCGIREAEGAEEEDTRPFSSG